MTQKEQQPKTPIVVLEEAVKRLDLRTGNLRVHIVDKNVEETAREMFFSQDPWKSYPEITDSQPFKEAVERLESGIPKENPLVGPSVQRLMLFRFLLLRQGYASFNIRADGKVLEFPLDDGFFPLAARMIDNQVRDYNKRPNDPREDYRQHGYPPPQIYRG